MAGNRAGTALNFRRILHGGAALTLVVGLAGCDENGNFSLASPAGDEGVAVTRAATSVQLIERDVEAPDVFQGTDDGLWDGRPSLGGVWVAHPDVVEPERVIIRNRANGKFVIGALFRRERANPGPELQVSSDAAQALGLLAGAPAELNVTALRREEVPQEPVQAAAPGPDMDLAETENLAAPTEIEATTLDPIAGAAAAIDAAEAAQTPVAAAPAIADAAIPEPTPAAVAPVPQPSGLEKPFIQIGIFSVEDNASRTADRMRGIGIVPTVLAQQSQGKPFWRVIVGPAQDAAERAALLDNVKAQGFTDAYFVTN